jgi:GDP-4-dehydro-6-deoxy-D-mannose reductase
MPGPILVTGAGGFVGGYLLAELGQSVVPSQADVTDSAAVAQEVAEVAPSAIVHLAALSSVADSWLAGAEVWRVNAIGTVNVLDAAAAERPAARVLVVSTGEVYGRADVFPTPEEAPLRPISPYAASKAAAELASERARISDGLDVVVARAFPHVGPRQDERFAVASWAAQIARLEAQGGGTLAVGDLSVERDLTDVRDVVRAYRLLLGPSVAAGTYNVASGRAVTLADVVETLVGLAECSVTVAVDEERLRPVDIPVLCGDPSRLEQATGWRPTIPLEQTLADTLSAARASLGAERSART